MLHRRRKQSAFVMLDVIIGMAVAGVLLLILSRSAAQQRDATRRLATHRTAVAVAEQTLTALQSAGKAPTSDEQLKIALRILDDRPPVESQLWVEVAVTLGTERATLLGLADRVAAEAFGKEGGR